MNLNSRLTIPAQVMSRLVGEETVLLDLASGYYFGLDGVCKVILEAVSYGKILADAVDAIVAEYDVERSQAESDVTTFVKQLVERGLLAE